MPKNILSVAEQRRIRLENQHPPSYQQSKTTASKIDLRRIDERRKAQRVDKCKEDTRFGSGHRAGIKLKNRVVKNNDLQHTTSVVILVS
ncbi:hypothetical protein B9Z55_026519 [Caenorhabditis nigoni]|uniref:IBB domain-containing protein n=1 Tax=Caenorhabditis nigoni TaxID=1611254 RepID=A0A2G5T3S3_9PELO|nr:hypothetical protein B9Z55_026519 [Caenorhabditis nigoni]